MIKLIDFTSNNLSITWTVIDIGYSREGLFHGYLAIGDLVDYSQTLLSVTDDPLIIEIACATQDEYFEVSNAVQQLAVSEGADINMECRKWRVLYVLSELGEENPDPIQGLITLGDIWSHLDYPSDGPHTMQGAGNDITTEDYYTKANYHILYNRSLEWIGAEKARLTRYDFERVSR